LSFRKDRLFESFLLTVERLDDELYKCQQFDTKETQEFLICGIKMIAFIKAILVDLLGKGMLKGEYGTLVARLALKLIEHLYFKKDEDNRHSFEFLKSELKQDIMATHDPMLGPWDFETPGSSFTLMKALAKVVHAGANNDSNSVIGDEHRKTYVIKAQLCRCFHYALHGNFRAARDILHYSSMYERALNAEIHTQILYNRAFAQTGLCAFKNGLIPEAHHYLSEICVYNKSKELLAQGVAFQRFTERNLEQERIERRRQLPYHMHLCLDHLEGAHLVCALLLEIPNMMQQQVNGSRGRLISKALRKYLETMDRNIFSTPAESTREHILHAALGVQAGDWSVAMRHLKKVSFLSELIQPSLLEKKVKEESLRCYCLRYATAYASLDLSQLCEMFGLEREACHSLCSRMILDGEVQFAWDETSSLLLVKHREAQRKFQRLAQSLAEKCTSQLENHERTIDFRSGNHYSKGNDGQKQQGGALNFRDVSSEEVRHFNRSRYAAQRGMKGALVAGGKGRKGGKGGGKDGRNGGGKGGGHGGGSGLTSTGGKGKGGARVDAVEGLNIRAGGWNRGARDMAVGYAFQPEQRNPLAQYQN